ncbi:DUF3048 domain-containing protein [Aeromicrobium sp. CTD01-1L150]|uniref:DUF3048 domain-containing protein n=1 Tax=Aeromicrobium sp. CTD01-1L150 TaxID=3341830 RepID=UPI0035C1C262
MTSRLTSLIVPVAALALVLGGCSSQETEPDPTEGEGKNLVEVSPLTGEQFEDGPPDNPVMLVKIENTPAGAPQKGLEKADLVVEQLVEGGLTRLAAFYHSNLPKTVGHVRSLRTTDISLAKPVAGTIVASGGAGGVVDRVKRNKLGVVIEDEGGDGFRRDPGKSAPYDRLIDMNVAAERAEDAEIPGPYLPFAGDADDGTGPEPTKASSASVEFSPGQTTEWKLGKGTWKRTNGFAEKEFAADNLIVLEVPLSEAGYTDAAGNPVPETILKGKGKATILTADGAVDATWSKKGIGGQLSFTADGEEFTIDQGKTWIEMIPQGQGSVSVE